MDDFGTPIHKGHRSRLKGQIAEHGLNGLLDHQVLEYLLFFGIPYKDTNPVAHALIRRFGSLSAVLEASAESLMEIPNMTQNAALLLSTLPDLFLRYSAQKATPREVFRATDILPYLRANLRHHTIESLIVLSLDAKHQLLHNDCLSAGSAAEVESYAKKIVEIALRHKATGVILAHNHPSGNVIPSKADMTSTANLKHLLKSLDIDLIDHIIIGADAAYSFFLKTRLTDGEISSSIYPLIPLST